MKKIILITALAMLSLVSISNAQSSNPCCLTPVKDQLVTVYSSYSPVVAPGASCDSFAISWTMSVLNYSYKYSVHGTNLYVWYTVLLNGAPYLSNIDTTEGWCAIAVEKGVLAASMPDRLETSPNPFKSQVTLRFSNPESKANLNIFDVKGALVYSQDNITGSSVNWNAQGVRKGVYFVRVTTPGKTYKGEIIKQ